MHRRKIRSTLALAYVLWALGPQACQRWQAVDEPTVAPAVGVWGGDGGAVAAEEEATGESVAARDDGGAPVPANETRERRAEHEKPAQPGRAD